AALAEGGRRVSSGREGHEVDRRDESGLVAAPNRLRIELLQTKGELERQLRNILLYCRRCKGKVPWVSGMGRERGRWRHAERPGAVWNASRRGSALRSRAGGLHHLPR